MTDSIGKSEVEWRKLLTPEQYEICRNKGTERAFTGQYWNCHDPGVYRCVCCASELFSSETKFDSRTGWPSFWEASDPDRVKALVDVSHGMRRIEVSCSRCGAHLGHAFDDGPPPTGQRYCINSVALRIAPKT